MIGMHCTKAELTRESVVQANQFAVPFKLDSEQNIQGYSIGLHTGLSFNDPYSTKAFECNIL